MDNAERMSIVRVGEDVAMSPTAILDTGQPSDVEE